MTGQGSNQFKGAWGGALAGSFPCVHSFCLGAIMGDNLNTMGLSSYINTDIAMLIRDSIRNQAEGINHVRA